MPVETCCSQVRGFSDRSHSGGHFSFIFAAVINILPAHCGAPATGGPRGFRFQNPLEAISSFITISHSLPLALGMHAHAAHACSPPVGPRGVVENKAGCLMKTLAFSTFHLLQINQTLDFFFCNHAALNHGGRPAA